jgi:hypothetical protein
MPMLLIVTCYNFIIMCVLGDYTYRDVDIRQQPQSASALRKQFVAGFGRQNKKSNLDREAAEEQAKRMKYISEKRSAVPTHRLDRS